MAQQQDSPAPGVRGRTVGSPAARLTRELAGLSGAERDRVLVDLVRTEVANATGRPGPASIRPDLAFRKLGVYRHIAADFRDRLSTTTGLRIPATLIFDYPTPAAVADYVAAALFGAAEPDGPAAGPVSAGEPIAIVGMSCRYPGDVRSPDDLWQLVASGTDAISGLPTNRGWDIEALYDPDPDHFGTCCTREGGFLHDAPDFDPEFFGISPREALGMDPQQRLLLEISWEALERAGIDPTTVRGESAAVYVGVPYTDYGPPLYAPPEGMQGHLLTGNLSSVASGRISYVLGLEGPAVTMDTACSSSLVTLHLACQSLRQNECTLALAGGVTVMSAPGVLMEFSRKRGLSGDGRCRSFSTDASGTGWGEGAGLLVLERLSDARRRGHHVLAVVRGSAMNQDGASNGLTAPNGPAQQRVIRQALANAGLSGTDIDAVEAHGTGTPLGDPIEAQALLATYGQGRDARPLWLGSLKSNIGHTQGASGVGGVIKMVQAMRHELLPKTLHVAEPSAHVDWTAGGVSLLTEPVEWPAGATPRRAGVSSFGVSGTNVHVIIEDAPPPEPTGGAGVTTDRVVPWVLSGRDRSALRAQAQRLVTHLADHPGLLPTEVGLSLATTRSAFEHRAVVIGDDHASLAGGLAALAGGEPDGRLIEGVAQHLGRSAFVFPGQGWQWAGMAVELLDSAPVFADRLAQCADALAEFVDWSLLDVLRGLDDAPGLDRVDVVQPVLFAVMVALAELWRSIGVYPDAVVGHSQGEIAAACVAGILSLSDGARIVALRSRALLGIAGGSGMLSVAMPRSALVPRLTRWGERVSVAAINSPTAVVLSGDDAALGELADECAAEGIRAKRIPVDYASHSAHVTRIRDELIAALEPVRPRAGTIPFFSTVTGDWLAGPEMDAEYWYTNLRETVNFERATRGLLEAGYRVFVECSAHPVLTMAVGETIDAVADVAAQSVVTGSLRRGDGGLARFRGCAAEVYVRGVAVDWRRTFDSATATVELPTYPFQRQRYWLDAPMDRPAAGGTDWADGGFWEAVESSDPAGLAGLLRIEEESVARLLPALSAWRQRRQAESVAGSWRYRIGWSALEPLAGALSGRWLLVAPQDGAGDDLPARLATALRAAGAEPVLVTVPTGAVGRAALTAALDAARGDEVPTAGVVSLLAFDETPDRDHPVLPHGLAATLRLIQAHCERDVDGPLWCLTQGAVAASPTEAPTSPAQAQVWGLGRVAALEHPHHWGGLVDLPTHIDDASLAQLCQVLAAADEDQVAVRASGPAGRRLLRAAGSTAGEPWHPRGTVLITGGTGALGAHLARWLAAGGAEHIVLVSRRGPAAPGAAELRAELAGSGVRASVHSCDLADRDSVAQLLAVLRSAGDTVNAVVHAAGVVTLAPLADSGVADFAEIAAGKVAGARNLDSLLDRDELDTILYFSSIAAAWGVSDHGGYAAANAFLDALAQRQRAEGIRAHTIAWGPWAGGGMIVERITEVLRRRGVPVIDPGASMAALQGVMDRDEATAVIADVDWERFAPVFSSARPSPLLRDIPDAQPYLDLAGHDTGGTDSVPLARELAGLVVTEQDRVLRDVVRGHAARVLGHPGPDDVDVRRAFTEMGFDSLTAVELRNALNLATGLRLPATSVFDYPNVTALAAHLRGELVGEPGPVARPAHTAAPEDDPVAIIAMSCRYAGGVASPDDLWQLVVAGGDAVSMFPTDRGWDIARLYRPDAGAGEGSYVREGGFLHDAADFDPAFFDISPREALAMDPQQRLALETSWEAFERAGLDRDALRGGQVGVFLGMADQGHAARLQQADAASGYLVTGGQSSVASGRIAYAFGLEGPALTVDTACSSSLVALHLAAQSLRRGECQLALTGGVAVMSSPMQFVGFSRQRGLAPDGRCKPFADAADGFGLAEGVGMLVLERLSDATANGHPVLAVVRGSAVNQDGASNGLTAPNGPSQQRVIRQALADAALDPADIDVIEAHGTGTRLGDPIEAQALLATYGPGRPAERPLWLGSVKSNIGHAQTASGVAGIIKMVQAMRHGLLPKTLHIDAPSSQVDWSRGAIRLLSDQIPWPETGGPRRAGVSSFGISGTNAHVILEQPEPADTAPVADPADAPTVPWVLSARGDEALCGQATRLLAHLDGAPPLRPVDVGNSLLATRSAFEQRAVVIGAEEAALRDGVAALASGTPAGETVTGTASVDGRIALVFPGQGSAWAGMAVELLDSSPVFARAFGEIAEALGRYAGWSAVEVLRGTPGAPDPDRVDVVQPLSFAVMVALAELWRHHGVRPDAVVGHSQGEIAAACVAGVLTVDDAARLVVQRSIALVSLAGRGAMATVTLPAAAVAERLTGYDGRIAVAARNGPGLTVVSGDPAAIDDLLSRCVADGIRARRISVDYASHSAQVEDIHDELAAVTTSVTMHDGTVPVFSTVTGDWLRPADTDGHYWYRNLREQVDFEGAIRSLAAEGYRVFVECSAHPVLTTAVGETLEALGLPEQESVVTGSLRRGAGGLQRFYASLAEAYVRGVPVTWRPVYEPLGARRVELPTYAFQHDRFWVDIDEDRAGGADPVDARFWRAVDEADLPELIADEDIDARSWQRVLPAMSRWRQHRRDDATVDRWRYRIAWSPLTTGTSTGLPGTWLVAVPEGVARAATVLRALAGRGTDVVGVEVAPTTSTEQLTARLHQTGPVAGVLSLLALDERPAPAHPVLSVGLVATISLARALAEVGVEAPLWCATRSAVSVGSGDPLTSPVQAQTWGLGTVLGLDHPARWGGLVDLPEVLDRTAIDRLCGVLRGGHEHEQVALRASGVFGRRLLPAPLGERTPMRNWRPRGTVLVTGGTGSLGGHVARWLAREGAEHIVLTSRRGLRAPGAPQLADELVRAGARVTIAACDVSDRSALAALLAGLPAQEPVTAVFHAAGVPGEQTALGDLDPTSVSEVMAGKVAGARHLDELLDPAGLDAFVLFSSGAGVWGAGGQIAYAAANSYLDALAQRRRAAGAPATAVCWGSWAGGGMIDDAQARAWEVRGLREMAPALAVLALRHCLDHDDPVVVVADIDWEQFLPGYTFAGARPLMAELADTRIRPTASSAAAHDATAAGRAGPLASRLAGLPATERDRAVLDLVRGTAAAVLRHDDTQRIRTGTPFKQLGFDSLTAVEFRNKLNAATGLRLPATAVFDYPTPRALATFVLAALPGGDIDESALAELDRLGETLAGAKIAAATRTRIGARLRDMLALCGGEPAEGNTGSATEFGLATDDEMFDLIDQELAAHDRATDHPGD